MIVVDSSAVIAALTSEPGHELVDAAIAEGAAISSINLAEVVSVMIRRPVATDLAVAAVRDLPLAVMDFTEDLAIATGVMVAATQKYGLSLGDRACLALARHLGSAALTSDRMWAAAGSELGIEVRLLRGAA